MALLRHEKLFATTINQSLEYFLENVNNKFPEVVTDHSKYFYDSTKEPESLLLDDTNNQNFSKMDDNFWAVFDQQYLKHSLNLTSILVVTCTLILIFGVIGNCLVILIVIKRPQMWKVTNIFIMNLAVADLFVVVFCVPATLISNVFKPWILGSEMCKAVAYVQGVSVCASAYSLAAVSLDRCKAIHRPLERPQGLSKRQAVFTIILIWIISFGLIIPWVVIFDVVVSETDGLSHCIETWGDETHENVYFLVVNFFFCYSLPLILISISNLITCCNVSRREVPSNSASACTIQKMHRKTRRGVRKLLMILTLTFLLSWLPLYIIIMRVKLTENIGEWEYNLLSHLMPITQLLGSLNSSINPVLYAFFNTKFQNMFKSLLPAWMSIAFKVMIKPKMRNGYKTTSGLNIQHLMKTTAMISISTLTNTKGNNLAICDFSFKRYEPNHGKSSSLPVKNYRGCEHVKNSIL